MRVLVAVLILTAGLAAAEVFTASTDLASTFQLEFQVVNVLNDLILKTESKLNAIRSYLRDYSSIVEEKASTEDEFMERIAGNPIHAYRLMKRLTIDWSRIESEMRSDHWKDALRELEQMRMVKRFPQEEDFHGAAQALIRLQDTYELNMTELVQGNVWGRQTHAELTAQDCLFMGKHSFNAGIYSRAVEWFQQAFTLAGLEGNRTVGQDQVLEFLQHAITMHDESLQRSGFTGEHTFLNPLREKPAEVQRTEMINSRKYKLGKHISFVDDAINFNALCRGENLLSDQVTSRMKCWYDNRKEPYFYLMPIKVEMHADDPELYTFHDVISDEEIEAVKNLAKPLLMRSMVQGDKMGAQKSVVSSVRTSKTAWLSEAMDPLMKRISRRVSMITGLLTNPLMDHAELLQVANYGIGGHYNPHHDYLIKDPKDRETMPATELKKGDRIATFMFYLNDVERGGRTAFPRIGAALSPVKGAAAFWYNLKRSGKPDPMTLHGACPVLLGFKWVSNKWIRETAQTFHRPCLLDANE